MAPRPFFLVVGDDDRGAHNPLHPIPSPFEVSLLIVILAAYHKRPELGLYLWIFWTTYVSTGILARLYPIFTADTDCPTTYISP